MRKFKQFESKVDNLLCHMITYPKLLRNERKTATEKSHPTFQQSHLDEDLLAESEVDEGKEEFRQVLRAATLDGTVPTCSIDTSGSSSLTTPTKQSNNIFSKCSQFQ